MTPLEAFFGFAVALGLLVAGWAWADSWHQRRITRRNLASWTLRMEQRRDPRLIG